MARTYVVTGASSGIGLETRSILESRDSKVIGVDLHGSDIDADLATFAGRREAVKAIGEISGGRIDALIANAGSSAPVASTISVNFYGATELIMGPLEHFPVLMATAFTTHIALIDIREFRIPNRLLKSALALTGMTMALVSLISLNPSRLLVALLGGSISTLAMFGIHLVNPRGLGMGDVKLAALIGATLSWISFPNGLLGFAVAFITSSAFAILQFVLLDKPLNRFLPFAPFLLLGLIFVEVGQFV